MGYHPIQTHIRNEQHAQVMSQTNKPNPFLSLYKYIYLGHVGPDPLKQIQPLCIYYISLGHVGPAPVRAARPPLPAHGKSPLVAPPIRGIYNYIYIYIDISIYIL